MGGGGGTGASGGGRRRVRRSGGGGIGGPAALSLCLFVGAADAVVPVRTRSGLGSAWRRRHLNSPHAAPAGRWPRRGGRAGGRRPGRACRLSSSSSAPFLCAGGDAGGFRGHSPGRAGESAGGEGSWGRCLVGGGAAGRPRGRVSEGTRKKAEWTRGGHGRALAAASHSETHANSPAEKVRPRAVVPRLVLPILTTRVPSGLPPVRHPPVEKNRGVPRRRPCAAATRRLPSSPASLASLLFLRFPSRDAAGGPRALAPLAALCP